jgi:hypothetical protein
MKQILYSAQPQYSGTLSQMEEQLVEPAETQAQFA